MGIKYRTIHNLSYFFWGIASSFSLLTDNPVNIQICAPIPILLFWLYIDPMGLIKIFFSKRIGVLISFSVIVVAISAFVNGFTVLGLIRYLALLPAFMVLLRTCEEKVYLNGALRSLALSSFVFVLYHLGSADLTEVLNPNYRLELFLNTNGVAFIACMCVLVHIVLLLQKRRDRSNLLVVFYLIAVLAGIVVLFLTRSRTATLAFIGGLLSLPFAMPGLISKKINQLIFWGIVAILLLFYYWSSIFESVSFYYSFFDKYRGIETATNRTDIWSYTFNQIIMKNFFIGIGPGNHFETIEKATGFTNANNGLLIYMAEIGFFGTLPYLILLILTFVKTIKSNGLNRLFLVILIAGFIESIGETMLFSTGSVGSLIFLLVVAAENGRRNTTDD